MSLNVNEIKLGVIGCGKMASAILGGIVKNNFLPKENISVFDINLEASASMCAKYGFEEALSIDELVLNSDIILLCVKPFVFREVILEVKQKISDQLIISILAGVKLEKYNKILPETPVVRVMPNTPALIGMGASALCKNQFVDESYFDFAKKLMKNCGEVIETSEDKIDIITALSGSGPAYYYKIIDLMAKAAIKLGLDKKQAYLLSSQTALGSAKMVIENDFDIETLIKNVTTPGGCTEVGNEVLNNSNIDEIIDKTIKDTMEKSIKLG